MSVEDSPPFPLASNVYVQVVDGQVVIGDTVASPVSADRRVLSLSFNGVIREGTGSEPKSQGVIRVLVSGPRMAELEAPGSFVSRWEDSGTGALALLVRS